MFGSSVPVQTRAEAGAKVRVQPIVAARFLAQSSSEVVSLLAEASLANPALGLTLDLDDDPPTRRPRVAMPVVSAIDAETTAYTTGSLYAHVAMQISLLVRDRSLLPLAYAWLEGLEPSGWVNLTASEVAQRCGTSEESAEYVLHLLQGAEPDGLFARSLKECLTLQLRAQGDLTPGMSAILDHLPLLASGDLNALAERTGVLAQFIPGFVGRLRRLNPKPGVQFQSDHVALAAPDYLILRDTTSGWELQPGRWLKPTLSPEAPEARRLGSDLRSAASLASMVENRNRLVLRTVQQALNWQADYLDGRRSWLRPMVLADLAGPLGVHATSIGRIRNHVVIGDRNRALRLRDLFAHAISTVDGPPISSRELKSRIDKVKSGPTGSETLSDEQIRRVLMQTGIAVSRRTVAKYRALAL
jgi:RNA polymerase sigma-54 factor